MAEQGNVPLDEPADDSVEFPDDAIINEEIALEFARDERAMIRTLGTLIEASAKPRGSATNARVALAMDWMIVAACERIARICRADMKIVENTEVVGEDWG